MRCVEWALIIGSAWLAAGCGGAGPPTTITITTDAEPALVAFRDDATWQIATRKDARTFEAVVHDSYYVAVVCSMAPGTMVWQFARTTDDPHDLFQACGEPTPHAITGHMVKAGRVALGRYAVETGVDDSDFKIFAPPGTFDLVATSAGGRVVVRRDVVVDRSFELARSIDTDAEGQELAEVSFWAANEDPASGVSASVNLFTSGDLVEPTWGATVYSYFGQSVVAKVVPASALRATDIQVVELSVSSSSCVRRRRHVFRGGGDNRFDLAPAPLSVHWSYGNGHLLVVWGASPPFDHVYARASGAGVGVDTRAGVGLDLSASFVDVNGAIAVLETNIPGLDPSLRIDIGRGAEVYLVVQAGVASGDGMRIGCSETFYP